jgi:hypothetical protein
MRTGRRPCRLEPLRAPYDKFGLAGPGASYSRTHAAVAYCEAVCALLASTRDAAAAAAAAPAGQGGAAAGGVAGGAPTAAAGAGQAPR